MNKITLNNRIKYSFTYESNSIGVVFYSKNKIDISNTDDVELIFGLEVNSDDTRFPLMGIENIPINVSSFEDLLLEVVEVIKSFRAEYPNININFTVVKTVKTENLEDKAQLYINSLGDLSSKLEDNGNHNYTITT